MYGRIWCATGTTDICTWHTTLGCTMWPRVGKFASQAREYAYYFWTCVMASPIGMSHHITVHQGYMGIDVLPSTDLVEETFRI
jgi:hypothetical protein